MTTRIYGYSDDNVEAESTNKGEVDDEWGCYDTDLVLSCADGTKLHVHYGKKLQLLGDSEDGVWSIKLLKQGGLFIRIDECFDPEADIYSDIAHFEDGLTSIKVRRAKEGCQYEDMRAKNE